MLCLRYMVCILSVGILSARPFSVAALMESNPFQDAAPALLCDGKLLFQYGLQELRKISDYSENVLFVWRRDGTALLSKNFFDTALAALLKKGFPSYSVAQQVLSKSTTYALCPYGEDAAVVAYNSSTNLYSILGIIERGKSLLCGLELLPIAFATSQLSFPHISWDVVAYSYIAARSSAKVRPILYRHVIPYYTALYAYGCGIGYAKVMGIKKVAATLPASDHTREDLN